MRLQLVMGWDWNWDWRTPAPALNGTGAPPVPAGATVDPTVPLVANGPPRAADAAQVVLGPVAQANTAEASAAAGAQNQVTRITLTVANAQSPDIVQQVATASQRAEATASATQTAADNASIRLGNGETPQPLAATASAAPVVSTGSVGQSNASTTASVATTASSAVQSVLQAEVSGGPTAGMPSVDQQLHLGQVAVATSTAAQTGVANLAIADLSAGGPISIEQSSSATATASAADTSTVYQGSEQAQAGSASDQGVTQIALVGQTGSASASVEQTGAANTAVARGTHGPPRALLSHRWRRRAPRWCKPTRARPTPALRTAVRSSRPPPSSPSRVRATSSPGSAPTWFRRPRRAPRRRKRAPRTSSSRSCSSKPRPRRARSRPPVSNSPR